MADIEALAVALACFAFAFALLFALERVLMAASDIFGLIVAIGIFMYLVYALLRGERF